MFGSCKKMSTRRTCTAAQSSVDFRICDNPVCKATKFLETQGKSNPAYKFMSSAGLADTSMLIDSKIVAFQVTGALASVADVVANADGQKRQLYRIKRNTHTHVINRIFINKDQSEDLVNTENMHRFKADLRLRALMSKNATRFNATRIVKRKVAASEREGKPVYDLNVRLAAMSGAEILSPGGTTRKILPASSGATGTDVYRYQTEKSPVPEAGPLTPGQIIKPLQKLVGGANSALTQRVAPILPISMKSPIYKSIPAADIRIKKIQEELDDLRRTVAKLSSTHDTRNGALHKRNDSPT